MTDVVFAPRREDPTSDTEAVLSGATFRIRPSADYTAGGQWVLAVWSALQQLTGSAVTMKLDALPATPYELELTIPDSSLPGGRRTLREFRIVPSSGTPVTWESCARVPGPGSTPAVPTALEARVSALESAIGSVSGGASNLASITDMSAFMRTVNDDTSAAAARTTLGAAPAGSRAGGAIGYTDLGVTGSPGTTTFLRGDGSWSGTPAAGNPAWADITDKPTVFAPDDHTQTAATISDSTVVGRGVLTAADAAGARAAIGALGGSDVIDDANLVVAGVMFADGASTPRPTTRTDIRVLWTAASAPTNAFPGDVWLNGPDS